MTAAPFCTTAAAGCSSRVLCLSSGYRGQKGERGQPGLGLPGDPGDMGPPGKGSRVPT
uniref:Uncharacterized protein n=1 Tax=Takifugu rubripes TaxID=31033 RepID=A0A674NMS1_TAKRU